LLVDNNAPAEQLSLRDLQPATWYQLRLTAHNDAGSTRAHFRFATTTITGGKAQLKYYVEAGFYSMHYSFPVIQLPSLRV
jgi:hypothetical protein